MQEPLCGLTAIPDSRICHREAKLLPPVLSRREARLAWSAGAPSPGILLSQEEGGLRPLEQLERLAWA